ncbi:DUF2071 domain-containing protein [Luteolibacter flavescens]|uniref:DUF2071 domain-containing protein n=1 Tax=Luteolibacter flavescens TaxID=1859460 RepID=A0ABT3FIR1_9BACT|nr:DUF2071 domain-containing protein [Luteolibacter flavescens]MCW1883244.1 DUF2071 domain-containing protein [Luteolibacter flavescens]
MNPVELAQRLAARERPTGRPVMKQRWSRLLFLHWRVDPELLRPLLPPGLHLDLHEGEAWLGVVPFLMERVRPVMLPAVPGLSWFLELNVRIYCHDDSGQPGVWFLSLDCNQPVAVELARRLFLLPYQHARMRCGGDLKATRYHCLRSGETEEAIYEYGPDGEAQEAEPGSLEFFLLERYVLFSSGRNGQLFSGKVHHPPYRWAQAKCDRWSTLPMKWDGLPEPHGKPESALWSERVDVDIFPLRRLMR